jgi:homocitrate synthase NifV
MSEPIVWHDQTLQEGLRYGVGQETLLLIAETLQEAQVGSLDVSVADCRKYALPEDLLQRTLRGSIQPCRKEIALARQLGFQKVIVSYIHQPGQCLPLELCVALEQLQNLDLEIALHMKNASQISSEELEDLWPVLEGFPISTFIYGDRESRLDPFITNQILTNLQRTSPFFMEFHAHNAYGLATANTLSAIQAGVRRVATSVAGIGGRGHAAFEEGTMAARHILCESDIVSSHRLAQLCARVIAYLGGKLPVDKAVVGRNIFAHESGIHVHGVSKNPRLYEAFSPEEVGLVRHLVVGKHSGTTSLQVKLQEKGIQIDDAEAQCLLKQVRRTVVEQKKPLSNMQLLQLYTQTKDVC